MALPKAAQRGITAPTGTPAAAPAVKAQTAATLTQAPSLTDQSVAQPADDGMPWETAGGQPAAAPAPAPAPAVAAAAAPAPAPIQIETPANKQVAVAPAPAPVVHAPVVRNAMAGIPDDGFSDLDEDVGFGSYPIISLDKDKFKIGNAERVAEFQGIILQSRDKWIYKAREGDDSPLFYSYDGITDSAGRQVEARIQEWINDSEIENRESVLRKKYKEVVVMMLDTSLEGRLALLSIPPASKARLAGYRGEVGAIHKCTMKQVITLFKPGDLIVINPKVSFYPWDFVCMRKLEDHEQVQ